MKVLFSKYNRFRKPEFSLETMIYEENNKRYVCKKALTSHAQSFVQDFPLKKQNLESVTLNKSILYNKIVKETDSQIVFEYVKGQSYQDILFQAYKSNDRSLFLNEIDNFYSLLSSSFKTIPSFDYTQQLFNIPQEELKLLKAEPSFSGYTNFDFVFSNLKKANDGEYHVIDYEWVFPYSLPISFLLYRNLYFFYHQNYLGIDVDSFVSFTELLEKYKMTQQQVDIFDKIEDAIQESIRGNILNTNYRSKYLKQQHHLPSDNMASIPSSADITKLYYDTGEGFNEENTLSQQVTIYQEKSSKFEIKFNISATETAIKSLRWDPTDQNKLIIKLNSFKLVDTTGVDQAVSLKDLTFNGQQKDEKTIIFYGNDPNINIQIPDHFSIKQLSIEGEWKSLATDEIAPILIEYFNHCIAHLNTSIHERNLIINEHNAIINEQNTVINDKENHIRNLDDIISDKDRLLTSQSETINNLNHDIADRQELLDYQSKRISQHEETISSLTDNLHAQQLLSGREQLSNIVLSNYTRKRSLLAESIFKLPNIELVAPHNIRINEYGDFHSNGKLPFIAIKFKKTIKHLRIKLFISAPEDGTAYIKYSKDGENFSQKDLMVLGQANSHINQYIKFPEGVKEILIIPFNNNKQPFKVEYLSVYKCNPLFFSLKQLHNFYKLHKQPEELRNFVFDMKTAGLCTAITKQAGRFMGKHESCEYQIDADISSYIKDAHELIKEFPKKPLISLIMPVYNIDPKWLHKAIQSLNDQFYDKWELCIADDCSTNRKTRNYLKACTSKLMQKLDAWVQHKKDPTKSIHDYLASPKIKVKFLEKNLGISGASNAAAELATGDYISFLDNDDELTKDALYHVVRVINEKDPDFIYSDEMLIDENGALLNNHFKPDYSPDLLLAHNYITHLSTVKMPIFRSLAGFRSDYDGAQDYDLFLRVVEKTEKIHHIPRMLYLWRALDTSTSFNPHAKNYAHDAGKQAIKDALKRRGIQGEVLDNNMMFHYRLKRKLLAEPLISIIIPFKDQSKLLKQCIDSIESISTYQNYEVIGVNNNSEEEETFAVMKDLGKKYPKVKFLDYSQPFNFSKINNFAVKQAKGEHILLLNNDIEIITPDWLQNMLEHSQRPEVGAVGAKLYYPDDTIQHAGVIIGIGGTAGHSHKCFSRKSLGYFNRLNTIQNLSAVTGACLMVKKSLYDDVRGLDEEHLAVAFNDVDFCLRLRQKGFLNIFTPFVEAYHYESISRGYEDTPDKVRRFEKEQAYMDNTHAEILANGDPYYNPNLPLDAENFSLDIE